MSQARVNILYLSHSAQLYGAERSLLELLKGLDRDRFSPVVVLPKEGPLKWHIAELSIPVEIVPSIRKWLTSTPWVLRPLRDVGCITYWACSVASLVRLFRQYQIDLVHTNSLVIIEGALAAHLLGVPHVWHAREIITPGSQYRFLLGQAAVRSLIAHLADRVITISNAVRSCLEQKGNETKLVLIYNAIDTQDFDRPASEDGIRQTLGMSDADFLVGVVAGLIPAKGYEDFISAAAKVRRAVPNTRFVAVGGASRASYWEKIAALITRLDLEDCFTLLGFRKDAVDIISALDLLVLPSRYEPFGRVLMEAMAAGKPVIGTNVGGIPEIIEDGVTGLLVPPSSPNELARAIIKILQYPDLAQRMGAAGRESAMARFSPERYVTQIQQIYGELIEKE